MSSQAEVYQPSNEQLWTDCSQLFELPHNGPTLEASYWFAEAYTARLLEQHAVLKQINAYEAASKYIITVVLTTYPLDRSSNSVANEALFGLIKQPGGDIAVRQRLHGGLRTDLDEIGRALFNQHLQWINDELRYRNRHHNLPGKEC